MKKVKIIVLILIIIAISIIIINHTFPKQFDEYNMPYNITVTDIYDKNNVLIIKNDDNNIYIFNLRNNSCKLFKKPQIAGDKIVNMKLSNKWIVWMEEKNNHNLIYSENRQSHKIMEIGNCDCKTIQLYNNFVVYGMAYTTKVEILLKDLNTTTNEITLDEKLNDDQTNISIPDISDNKVVWSKDKFEKSTNLISADIYMYDITTHQKKIISKQSNIFKPKINGNKIIGTCIESNKNYTKSLLSIYDSKENKWNKLISQESDIYKNLKYVSIDDPIIDHDLLTWWDNYSKNMYIYNIKENKFVNINSYTQNDNVNQIYFLKNKMIFFRSTNGDNTIQIQKCIILS